MKFKTLTLQLPNVPDELKGHLDALRTWIEQQAENIPDPEPRLTNEERKQLHAVNKSIEQLTRLGVSIPDDLRKLKLQLSAKDSAGPRFADIEPRLMKVEALAESLRELLGVTRSVRDTLKGTGQNPGAKKHYGVSLKQLLQSAYLSAEDKIELQWVMNGPTYEGKLSEDGTLTAKTRAGWHEFDSLSTAASSIAGRPLNGWDHWRRVNPDGSRTALKEIRVRFMNKGGAS